MFPLETALKVAKSFTASRSKKYENVPRPSLRGAWVTEQYVYASDFTQMIRIEHNEDVKEPYQHMYSPSDIKKFERNPNQYPAVDGLIPDRSGASWCFQITDYKEWLQIHEMAAVVKDKDFAVTLSLEENVIRASNPNFSLGLEFTYKELPLIRNIHYRPFEPQSIPLFRYDSKNMIKVCKALKQLKYQESFSLYSFEDNKPLFLDGPGVSFLILPIIETIKVNTAPEVPKVNYS